MENLEFRAIFDGSQPVEEMSKLQQAFKDMVSSWIADTAKAKEGVDSLSTVEDGLIQAIRSASGSEAEFKENIVAVFNSLGEGTAKVASLGANFENLGTYLTSAASSVVDIGATLSATNAKFGQGALSASEMALAVGRLKGAGAELAGVLNATKGVTAEQSATFDREAQLANISSEALARLATANKEVASAQANRKARQTVADAAEKTPPENQIVAHRALAAAYKQEEEAIRERNKAKAVISQQAGTQDNELIVAQAKADALEATYANKSAALESAKVTQLKANQALAEGTISEQYYADKVLAVNNAVESRTKTLNKLIEAQSRLKEVAKTTAAPASLPVVENLTAPTVASGLGAKIAEAIPPAQTLDQYLNKVKRTLFELQTQAKPINVDEYFSALQKPGASEFKLAEMLQVPREQLVSQVSALGREAGTFGDENKAVILSQINQAIKSVGLSAEDTQVTLKTFFQGVREGAADAASAVKTLKQTVEQFKEVPPPSAVLPPPPRPPAPPAPPAGGGGGGDDDEAKKAAALKKLEQAQIAVAEATARRQQAEKEWQGVPENQLDKQVEKVSELQSSYQQEITALRRLQVAQSEVRVTEAQQVTALTNEEEALARLEGMYAAFGEKRMAAEKKYLQAKIDDAPRTEINRADEAATAAIERQEEVLERIKATRENIASLKTTGEYPQRTITAEDVPTPQGVSRPEGFAQQIRSAAAAVEEARLVVERAQQQQIELEKKLSAAIQERIELVRSANERYGDVTAASLTTQSKILAATDAQTNAEKALTNQKAEVALAQKRLNDLVIGQRNLAGTTLGETAQVKTEPTQEDVAAKEQKVLQLKQQQDIASRASKAALEEASFFKGGPVNWTSVESYLKLGEAREQLAEISGKLATAETELANVQQAVTASQQRQAQVSDEARATATQEVTALRNKIAAYTDLDKAQLKVLESAREAEQANTAMLRSAQGARIPSTKGGEISPRVSGREGPDFSKQEDVIDAYTKQKAALQELIAVKEKDGNQYKITAEQVEALKATVTDLDAAFAKSAANTAKAASNVAYLERAYKDGAIGVEQLAKVENAQQSAAENTIAVVKRQIKILEQLRTAMAQELAPKDVTSTLEGTDAAIEKIVADTQRAVDVTESLRSKITEVQGKFVNVAQAAQVFKVTLGEGTGEVISSKLTSQINDLNNATLTTKLRQDELNDRFRALEKEAEKLGLTVKRTGQVFEILKQAEKDEEQEVERQAQQYGYLGGRMGAMIVGMNNLGFVFGILGRQVQWLNNLLSELFPLLSIGFAVDIIQNLVDKFTKAQDEIRKVQIELTDLAAAAVESAQAIEIHNLKLEDQLLKLSGGLPKNQLAEDLLAARKEAEQLTKALGDSLEKSLELIEKQDISVFGSALKGALSSIGLGQDQAPTSIAFGLGSKFEDVQNKVRLASSAVNEWRAAEAQLDLAIVQKNESAIASAQSAVNASKAAMEEAVIAARDVAAKATATVEGQVRTKAHELMQPQAVQTGAGQVTVMPGLAEKEAMAQAKEYYASQLAGVHALNAAAQGYVVTLGKIPEELKRQTLVDQQTYRVQQFKEEEKDIEPQVKSDEKAAAARQAAQKEFANLDKQTNEDLIKQRVQAATEGGVQAAKAEEAGDRARIAVEEEFFRQIYAIEDEAYTRQRSILEFKKAQAGKNPDAAEAIRQQKAIQDEINALDIKHNNDVINLAQTSGNRVITLESDINKRIAEEKKKALDKQLESFREYVKREEELLKITQDEEIQAATAYADDKKRAVDDEERFNIVTHKQALAARLAILNEEQSAIASALSARKAGLESLAAEMQKRIALTKEQQGADAAELKQLQIQLEGVYRQYQEVNKQLDETAVKFNKLKFDEQLKEWQRMETITSGFTNSTTAGFEQMAESIFSANKSIGQDFAQMIHGVERNFIRMVFSVLEQTKLFRGISGFLTHELDKVFHVKQPTPPAPELPHETPRQAAERVPQLPQPTIEKPAGYVEQVDLTAATKDATTAVKELTDAIKNFKPSFGPTPTGSAFNAPTSGAGAATLGAYSPAFPAPQLPGSVWELFGSNDKLADAISQFEAGKNPTAATRAIRNNNPGNLKYAGQPGAVPETEEPDAFAKFPTPEAGREALLRQLNSLQRRFPDITPEELIGGNASYSGYSPDKAKGNASGQAESYAAFLRREAGGGAVSPVASPLVLPAGPSLPIPGELQSQPAVTQELQKYLDILRQGAQARQPQQGTTVTTTTTISASPTAATTGAAPAGPAQGENLPVYDEGGYVPATGEAIVHAGEWVLTADQTKQALSGTGAAAQQTLVNVRMEYQPEGSRGGGGEPSAPSSVIIQNGSVPVTVQTVSPLQVALAPSTPIPVSVAGGQQIPLTVSGGTPPFVEGPATSVPAGAAPAAQGPSVLGAYGAAAPIGADFDPKLRPLFGFIGQLANLGNVLDKNLLKPLTTPITGVATRAATSTVTQAATGAATPATSAAQQAAEVSKLQSMQATKLALYQKDAAAHGLAETQKTLQTTAGQTQQTTATTIGSTQRVVKGQVETTAHAGQQVQQTAATATSQATQTAVTSQNIFVRIARGLMELIAHIFHQHGKAAATVSSQTEQTAATAGGEASRKATESIADISTIAGEAGVAGAAGFASVMAALPFPENIAVAPGVAAGASAATMGYAGLVAAKGGWDVPGGQAEYPAVLHAREMVLPAHIANNIRSMTNISSAAAAGTGKPSTVFGGNVHFNFNPHISSNMDPAKMSDMMFKQFKSRLKSMGAL